MLHNTNLTKKLFLFSFFFIILLSLAYSKETSDYLITKIIISINDEVTIYDKINLQSTKTNSEEDFPQTVLSYTNFKVGKNYTLKGLESELLQTKTRLIYSKYFYEIDLQIQDDLTETNQDTARYKGFKIIKFTLKNKTLHRFMPGLYWLQYGIDGINNQRKGFRITAGWNKLEAEIFHQNFANKNIYLSFLADYNNLFPQLINNEDGNSSIKFSTGYYFSPDFLLATDFKLQRFYSSDFIAYSDYEDTGISITPYFTLTKQFLKLNQSSGMINTTFSYYPFISTFSTSSRITANLNLFSNLQLGFLISGGYATPDMPTYGVFDLFSTQDNSIRSGYTKDELLALTYVLSSMELRYDFLQLFLTKSQKLSFQGFLFIDYAKILPSNKNLIISQGQLNNANAFGGGIRIKLHHPLMIFLSFNYGFNTNGSGRFVFTATAGY